MYQLVWKKLITKYSPTQVGGVAKEVQLINFMAMSLTIVSTLTKYSRTKKVM